MVVKEGWEAFFSYSIHYIGVLVVAVVKILLLMISHFIPVMVVVPALTEVEMKVLSDLNTYSLDCLALQSLH